MPNSCLVWGLCEKSWNLPDPSSLLFLQLCWPSGTISLRALFCIFWWLVGTCWAYFGWSKLCQLYCLTFGIEHFWYQEERPAGLCPWSTCPLQAGPCLHNPWRQVHDRASSKHTFQTYYAEENPPEAWIKWRILIHATLHTWNHYETTPT